jgi:hypothetical protein
MQNLQRHIGNIQNKNTAQPKKEKRETRYPPLNQKRNEREYISKLDQTESSALLSIKAEKGNNKRKSEAQEEKIQEYGRSRLIYRHTNYIHKRRKAKRFSCFIFISFEFIYT